MQQEKKAQARAEKDHVVMEFEYHEFTYSRDDIERGFLVKSHLGYMPLNPRNYHANSHDEVDWQWLRDVSRYRQQYQFFADADRRKGELE